MKLGATGKDEKESKGGVLARHESEPLSTLLYALGKNSDNFYAEMIFKSLARRGEGAPRARARTPPRSSRSGSRRTTSATPASS